MRDLNREPDGIKSLEVEWQQVYEASVAARADLARLRGSGAASGELVHFARLRLEQLEVLKARIREKIEELLQGSAVRGMTGAGG